MPGMGCFDLLKKLPKEFSGASGVSGHEGGMSVNGEDNPAECGLAVFRFPSEGLAQDLKSGEGAGKITAGHRGHPLLEDALKRLGRRERLSEETDGGKEDAKHRFARRKTRKEAGNPDDYA